MSTELPRAHGAPVLSARIRVAPEDFDVTELDGFEASGAGEHLLLSIEKRGMNTAFVARLLAEWAGVDERAVGYAGLKDRHAVTRQRFSVQLPGREAPGVESLERDDPATGQRLRVLGQARHARKLPRGALAGNRFVLVLRDVEGDRAAIEARLQAMAGRGVPNYFGEQRFGRAGDNAAMGRRILRGEERVRDRRLRSLLVSALQSEIFNRLLARRIREGNWDRPLFGDVLQKLDTGGLFVCEDPEVDLPRVRSFECSVTGPLPGPRMRPQPHGEPAHLEEEAIRDAGLRPEDFSSRREAPGARRPLRLPVRIALVSHPEGIVLDFELPPGAYATSLLREITKDAPPPP